MAQDKPAIAETRENDETDQLTDNSKPIADAPKGSTVRPEQPQAGTSTGDAGGRTRLGRFEVPSEKKDDLLDKGVTVPLVEGTRFHKAREALSSSVWEARRAASVDTTGESMERRDVPQNSYVDETGTWRGDSGLVLDRDRNAEVDAIRAERIVKLEERTSEEMQKLKDILGGDLEGWDFRLKGADRLKDKVAGTVDFSPRLSTDEAVRSVPDAVRYTLSTRDDQYVETARGAVEHLKAQGYTLALRKNTWDNNFYRGINSRWVDPETKQMFEVQFHTPSSYYAKEELNHKLYERARNPMTGRLEGRECNDLQATTTTLIPVPDGATELHFEPDDEEVK